MSAHDDMLEPFARLIGDLVTPRLLRGADHGDLPPEMWGTLEASGFADALVPEVYGGAGLTLADIHPLLLICGEHLLPQALGATMVSRALLASCAADIPTAPIVLWPEGESGKLRSLSPPSIAEAEFALVQRGTRFQVRQLTAGPSDGFGMVQAELTGPAVAECDLEGFDLFTIAAALATANMAGASAAVLKMTIEFANERNQFGRPLAKFQAIQHDLSRAAEHVAIACSATRLPFSVNSLLLSPLRVAIAKCIADETADVVCAVAHAVHGAIGISREYNLQLYTRRIKRWQASYGSRAFWAARIGAAHRESCCTSAVDFLRTL